MANWIEELGIEGSILDKLFNLQIKLHGKVLSRDIRGDLEIDYDTLEDQLAKMPALYAFWGMIYSEARKQAGMAKKAVRIRRGMVADVLIQEVRDKKIGRLNRGDIEDLAETDEELVKLEARQMEYDKISGKLWVILKALEMKSEDLRSLAGFKKQEFRMT